MDGKQSRSLFVCLASLMVAMGACGCLGDPGSGASDEQVRSTASAISLADSTPDAGASSPDGAPTPEIPPVLAGEETPLSLAPAESLSVKGVAQTFATGDQIWPSYLLYWLETKNVGTCPDCFAHLRNYLGKVSLPYYSYNTNLGPVIRYTTTLIDHYWIGETQYWEYEDKGFKSAYKYNGCNHGFVSYPYFGADKVSRTATYSTFCPPDFSGGCLFPAWTYSSWRNGW
jgi:hypothetical protein